MKELFESGRVLRQIGIEQGLTGSLKAQAGEMRASILQSKNRHICVLLPLMAMNLTSLCHAFSITNLLDVHQNSEMKDLFSLTVRVGHFLPLGLQGRSGKKVLVTKQPKMEICPLLKMTATWRYSLTRPSHSFKPNVQLRQVEK